MKSQRCSGRILGVRREFGPICFFYPVHSYKVRWFICWEYYFPIYIVYVRKKVFSYLGLNIEKLDCQFSIVSLINKKVKLFM